MKPEIVLTSDLDGITLRCVGAWDTAHGAELFSCFQEFKTIARQSLPVLSGAELRRVVILTPDILRFDSLGALVFFQICDFLGELGYGFFHDLDAGKKEIFSSVFEVMTVDDAGVPRLIEGRQATGPKNLERLEDAGIFPHQVLEALISRFGRGIVTFLTDLGQLVALLGEIVALGVVFFRRPSRFRWVSFLHHVEYAGVRAIPIIALMSFLIGGIIAQQGAFQLRTFGADIYVVNMVGVLMLREIGILLTAIMFAGRSGSAFTAEIGSMKMREEIDALKTMRIYPMEALVFPRIAALVVSLPLLTVACNAFGLLGGMIMSWGYSGISPEIFIDRLRDAVETSTFFVGLIKAPFMALIIGVVSCMEGLKVRGSADSLGYHTTSAVVKSIFAVIVVDGLFAMFFASINF